MHVIDEFESLRVCSGGNERQERLAELFTIHRSRLRLVVDLRLDGRLRRLFDPSDVLHEAFLDASRRLDEYVARGPMPVWLWLRRLSVQALCRLRERHIGAQKRSLLREVPIDLLALPHDPTTALLADRFAASQTSPSAAAARSELCERLREVLEAMDPVDREILVLRALEGLTRAEAAAVLEITEETAKKRYFRAMQRLRKAFGEGFDDASEDG